MTKHKKSAPFLWGLMAGVAVTLAVGACSPTVETRGNLIIADKLADIRPEFSTRAEVEQKWGPPSAVAAFDNKTWYYIGEQRETLGVFKNDVIERRVIAVTFNELDIVTSVEKLDPDKAIEVSMIDRKTPTAGKEFNVFQQLIGNVGRFNPNTVKNSGP